MTCNCGNPEFGFDCVCDWVKANPGNIEYCCEFCGMYTAGKPRCSKCEAENPEKCIEQDAERDFTRTNV